MMPPCVPACDEPSKPAPELFAPFYGTPDRELNSTYSHEEINAVTNSDVAFIQ